MVPLSQGRVNAPGHQGTVILVVRRERGRSTLPAPPCSSAASNVELHALGERQVARIVDGVGGAAHVGLPRVGAGLAAAAGVLLTAEGAADLGAAGPEV